MTKNDLDAFKAFVNSRLDYSGLDIWEAALKYAREQIAEIATIEPQPLGDELPDAVNYYGTVFDPEAEAALTPQQPTTLVDQIKTNSVPGKRSCIRR